MIENSVNRLGDFFKFLATNFLTNVAQVFDNFRGYFETCKTAVTTFWVTGGKFGYLVFQLWI